MAQLMPLLLTISCFSIIQIGFTFLVPAHPGSPGQRAVKRVCVNECVWPAHFSDSSATYEPDQLLLSSVIQFGANNPSHWCLYTLAVTSPKMHNWQHTGPCSNRSHSSKKGSPYSITECRVPELILVLCSQPASDASHTSGGRLPLLSTRPTVIPATLKRADTNFAAW